MKETKKKKSTKRGLWELGVGGVLYLLKATEQIFELVLEERMAFLAENGGVGESAC